MASEKLIDSFKSFLNYKKKPKKTTELEENFQKQTKNKSNYIKSISLKKTHLKKKGKQQIKI